MDYLQNVMGYFDQQQPLCAQHERISKDLYRSMASRPACATKTARACWRV